MELSQFIDHTLLKPTATPDAIEQLCNDAIMHQFYAVCVNSCYALLAVQKLQFERVKVVATIGFPLGAMSTEAKVAEAAYCIGMGVDEIDMVMNIGFLKAGLVKSIREEISAVKKVVGSKILKVIIETCFLSDEEKKIAAILVEKAGADFVKTSTGFGTAGATYKDVTLLRELLSPRMQIKASGGITNGKQALELIAAGATRIGTSNGMQLIKTQ
jgi:deoxyribose-phosphate aldolase